MKRIKQLAIAIRKLFAYPVKEKQLEVLNDTIKHYKLSNRSTNEYGGACTYYPRNPKASEGCAVGRLIKDKELCKQLDKSPNGGGVTNVFDRLPFNVQILGKEFLRELQNLHDSDYNWTEEGLSENGQFAVENIKKDYQLN